MALKPCKECKKEVSTQARKCPHCGVSYPTKNITQGCLVALILIVCIPFLVVQCAGNGSNESNSNTPKTAEEIRSDEIKKNFSVWDGSHIKLTKVIEESMHDPDSYEHIETRYIDEGKKLLVTTIFSGTNVYGGRVRSIIRAYTDTSTG